MGLDISAYSNLEFARVPANDDDDGYDDGLVHVYQNPDFPEQFSGLVEGLYRKTDATEEIGFRAGSYSGYNRWREELSMCVLGVMPEKIWDSPPAAIAGKPFVELIHFSDCEGSIGPAVCAKLLADFKEHRAAVVADAPDGWDASRWAKLYDEWLTAFALGSQSGVVRFH